MNRVVQDSPRELILVIDDQKEVHNLAQDALQAEFEVHSLETPSQSVLRAEKLLPSAILLDVNMGHQDGFEISRQLKRHPITGQIPIILMTAHADSTTSDRAHQVGAIGLIHKPLNVKTLANDIRNFLSTLNFELSSENGSVQISMHSDSRRKFKNLETKINNVLFKQTKTCIISLNDGEYFFSHFPHLKESLKNASLTYLKLKPSTLSKLTYMDSFSEILEDLRTHGIDPKSAELFVDEPEAIFKESKHANLSNFYRFAQDVGHQFKKVHYFFGGGSTGESEMRAMAEALLKQN